MMSTFDFIPQRVISLVPSVTESMFELGLESRLIGITTACTRPADKVVTMPTVGSPSQPDLVTIRHLNPDFVIMNNEANRREDQDAIEAAGFTVWVTGPRSVLSAINMMWDLMDILEMPHNSAGVREIERAYDFTEGAMRASRLVPVFVPLDQWRTFSEATYIQNLISICGGQNIFTDADNVYEIPAEMEIHPLLYDADREVDLATRYPTVSLDDVEERQPEIVLIPGAPYPFIESDVALFQKMDIPAAHNGHIYVIDGSLLAFNGIRVGVAMQELPPLFDQARRDA